MWRGGGGGGVMGRTVNGSITLTNVLCVVCVCLHGGLLCVWRSR